MNIGLCKCGQWGPNSPCDMKITQEDMLCDFCRANGCVAVRQSRGWVLDELRDLGNPEASR